MIRGKRLFGPNRFLPSRKATILIFLLAFAILSLAAWVLIVPRNDDAERRRIEADLAPAGETGHAMPVDDRMLRAFEAASLFEVVDVDAPPMTPPTPAMDWREGQARTFRVRREPSFRRFHEARRECEAGLSAQRERDRQRASQAFAACSSILDTIVRGRGHDDRWPIFYNLGLAEQGAGDAHRAMRELQRASEILHEVPEDRESLRARIATLYAIGATAWSVQNGALAFSAWLDAAEAADRLCGKAGQIAPSTCDELMKIGSAFAFDPSRLWAGVAAAADRLETIPQMSGDRERAMRAMADANRPIARRLREWPEKAERSASPDGDQEFWVLWGYDRVSAFSRIDDDVAHRAAADLVARVKKSPESSAPILDALLTGAAFLPFDQSDASESQGIFADLRCVESIRRGGTCPEAVRRNGSSDFAERLRWITLCRENRENLLRGATVEDPQTNAIGQGRFVHFANEWRAATVLDIAAPLVVEAGRYLDRGQIEQARNLLDRANRIAEVRRLPEYRDVVQRLPANQRAREWVDATGASAVGRWLLFALVAVAIAMGVWFVAHNARMASLSFGSLYRYEKGLKRRLN